MKYIDHKNSILVSDKDNRLFTVTRSSLPRKINWLNITLHPLDEYSKVNSGGGYLDISEEVFQKYYFKLK